MEYMIVNEPNPTEMQRVVNIHLGRGWQLYGPLFVSPDCGMGLTFHQAMTREGFKPTDCYGPG